MIDIFLSASVPLPTRDRKFFESADVLAIREAIKALVEIVLPVGRITCGGHPAITPLLSLFAQEMGADKSRLTIYQSQLFAGLMPAENSQFSDVRLVPADQNRDLTRSLTAMRTDMIKSRRFEAAIFVGGMEGLFEEAELFSEFHPKAKMLPVASTGAAARMIYERGQYDRELMYDLTYPTLFRRFLNIKY